MFLKAKRVLAVGAAGGILMVRCVRLALARARDPPLLAIDPRLTVSRVIEARDA